MYTLVLYVNAHSRVYVHVHTHTQMNAIKNVKKLHPCRPALEYKVYITPQILIVILYSASSGVWPGAFTELLLHTRTILS